MFFPGHTASQHVGVGSVGRNIPSYSLFCCRSRKEILQIPYTDDSNDNGRSKEEEHRDDEDDKPDEY